MSWTIYDEFIDLARARHVVIYRNADTGAEHQLSQEFNLPSCPHCGMLQGGTEPVDFLKLKADTLTALHVHHRTLLNYREKHPNVRLGDAPK
jgi:hypothetical protein